MKAISIGNRYEIHEDSLKSYDKLPVNTYTVRFDKMTGFYLMLRPDLAVKEKVYGIHPEKADKVLHTFSMFDRNLGIILSGPKGIGKSLFARLLATKAQAAGYPVIIVDQYIPGIAAYMASIDQEVVFLFDEFDKTFEGIRPGDNEADPQTGLLSMFDGTGHGKKLFVITCNGLQKLSDYLVNRPGRFHYHFRFEYPTSEEIQAYLNDNLDAEYASEIPKVVFFSRKVALNYDCLRAIVFELNLGAPFEKAIQDLNIINLNKENYDLTLYFTDGTTLKAWKVPLDLFDLEANERICLYDENGEYMGTVEFDPTLCIYDPRSNGTVVTAEHLILHYADPIDNSKVEKFKALQPDYLLIEHVSERRLHYLTGKRNNRSSDKRWRHPSVGDSELPF